MEPRLPLRLNQIDRQAILGLIDGDEEQLAEHATETVIALVCADKDEARLTLLAQDITAERLRRRDLQKNLDERICAKDTEGVAMIDKLLNSATKRLCALLAEHRASCSVGHRAAVLVGHVDEIRVEGGK